MHPLTVKEVDVRERGIRIVVLRTVIAGVAQQGMITTHQSEADSLDTDRHLPRTDGDHEQHIPTVIADISSSLAMDSNSSLSSRDEQEGDIHVPHPHPDTPSASSQCASATTSEYRPTPLRHRRQIHLSGLRETILPVSDPVYVEMWYLTPFYSDFFGSENVPEGRDPNEEMQLDLDQRRLEIRLLIRMTEKLQASVKKHAAAENRGGSNRVKR